MSNAKTVVNTTPHAIRVRLQHVGDEGDEVRFLTFEASVDQQLRCPEYSLERKALPALVQGGAVEALPVDVVWFGLPELPPESDGTVYLVSSLLLDAVVAAGLSRCDLFAPHRPLRDGAGHIIGCEGLRGIA